MASPDWPQGPKRVSLDDLSALCQQMVSLSRAGVPLDRGLLQLAVDLPPRLASHAERIGQRLAAGESLADAVSDQIGPFPAVYRSVVEAGLRSGKPTLALENFARFANQLAELQRLVLAALVYPIILLVVLFWIALSIVPRLGPTMKMALADLRPRHAPRDWLAGLLDHYVTWTEWFWVVPLLVLALALFWLAVSRVASPGGRRADWMKCIPGTRRLLDQSRLHAFTRVLSLLVEYRVPLEIALPLAGQASGDARLEVEAKQLAGRIQQGQGATAEVPTKSARGGIPPYLQWNLQNARQSGQLESTLRRAADTYHRRTEYAAQWLRNTLPLIFSVSLGAIVSLCYATLVLAPWYAILHALAAAMEAMY